MTLPLLPSVVIIILTFGSLAAISGMASCRAAAAVARPPLTYTFPQTPHRAANKRNRTAQRGARARQGRARLDRGGARPRGREPRGRHDKVRQGQEVIELVSEALSLDEDRDAARAGGAGEEHGGVREAAVEVDEPGA